MRLPCPHTCWRPCSSRCTRRSLSGTLLSLVGAVRRRVTGAVGARIRLRVPWCPPLRSWRRVPIAQMAAVPHKALPVYALYLLLAIWFQGADAHSTTREPMQALLALRPDLASVAVELNRTAARGVSVHVLHQSSDGLRAIRLPEGQSAAEVDPAEIESPASTDVSFGWAGSSEVFMHGSSSGTSRELRADAPGTFCFITTVSQLDADDRGCSLHVGLVVGKAGNRWIMDYEGGTHIGWYNDMSCGARCFWNTSVTPPDYAVLGERSSGHQAGLPESRSLPTLVAAKGIKDGLCHWRNEQVVGTAGAKHATRAGSRVVQAADAFFSSLVHSREQATSGTCTLMARTNASGA